MLTQNSPATESYHSPFCPTSQPPHFSPGELNFRRRQILQSCLLRPFCVVETSSVFLGYRQHRQIHTTVIQALGGKLFKHRTTGRLNLRNDPHLNHLPKQTHKASIES